MYGVAERRRDGLQSGGVLSQRHAGLVGLNPASGARPMFGGEFAGGGEVKNEQHSVSRTVRSRTRGLRPGTFWRRPGQPSWKDSDDGVRYADGRHATAPLALCEVQGYA